MKRIGQRRSLYTEKVSIKRLLDKEVTGCFRRQYPERSGPFPLRASSQTGHMDVVKVIAELRLRRDYINDVIAILEKLNRQLAQRKRTLARKTETPAGD